MGLFGKNQPKPPVTSDWGTRPIVRKHSHHLLEPPDLLDLVDQLWEEAGSQSPQAKAVVLERLLVMMMAQAERSLTVLNVNEKQHISNLNTIIARPDFTSSMIFDYLSQQPPMIWAVHNQLVELLHAEKTHDAVVKAIREEYSR